MRAQSAPGARNAMSSISTNRPDTAVVARRNAYIKDPGLDPVIAATRDRRAKLLEMGQQKRAVSGISGGVLHKQLELAILEKEIMKLEEGVEEYQNRIDLAEKEKAYIRKHQVEDREWCETFDRVIGPFEAKYEECQSEVRVMAEHGMEVYKHSFQKLIDDFGYHPAFKVCVSAESAHFAALLLALLARSPREVDGSTLSSAALVRRLLNIRAGRRTARPLNAPTLACDRWKVRCF